MLRFAMLFLDTQDIRCILFDLFSDPHHHERYMNYSDYLAVLNNETANPKSTGRETDLFRLPALTQINKG